MLPRCINQRFSAARKRHLPSVLAPTKGTRVPSPFVWELAVCFHPSTTGDSSVTKCLSFKERNDAGKSPELTNESTKQSSHLVTNRPHEMLNNCYSSSESPSVVWLRYFKSCATVPSTFKTSGRWRYLRTNLTPCTGLKAISRLLHEESSFNYRWLRSDTDPASVHCKVQNTQNNCSMPF